LFPKDEKNNKRRVEKTWGGTFCIFSFLSVVIVHHFFKVLTAFFKKEKNNYTTPFGFKSKVPSSNRLSYDLIVSVLTSRKKVLAFKMRHTFAFIKVFFFKYSVA